MTKTHLRIGRNHQTACYEDILKDDLKLNHVSLAKFNGVPIQLRCPHCNAVYIDMQEAEQKTASKVKASKVT